MGTILAQIIGTVTVTGFFALVAVFGPKLMYSESWRNEQLDYENARTVESATATVVRKNADKMDYIFSQTEVSDHEMNYMVSQYADAALPNASVLVAPGAKFNPRWSEGNARGALLEGTLLHDADLIHFPTPTSHYVCTIVTIIGMVPATMICGAMIAVYQRMLLTVLYYVTGMNKCESIESGAYMRTMVGREALVLAGSLLYAIATLAQAIVYGWLESGRSWSVSALGFWGGFLYAGVSHSPVKPAYMVPPQMTTWLSLCHFCMILHTSSAIGLVINSALRSYKSLAALRTLRLTDQEIRTALSIDHKRVAPNDINRPLYHN